MIRVFDSIAALRRECQKQNALSGRYGNTRNDFFGETLAQTERHSISGDDSLVPAAELLLSQLELAIETPRKSWDRNPAGAYCVVPDVLAGLPTPMRRLREYGDEHAPITILACSTVSASVTAEQISRRGTAILALVVALSRIRPISLYSVATMDGANGDKDETVISTRIETAPLDLSMACWMLTAGGFSRRMNYGLATKINGFTGGWPKRWYGNQEAYAEYLKTILGSDPSQTLVIPPTHINDPLLTQPVPWINNAIATFTKVDLENV